ncbi:MAG: methyltransferase domain-containing protein [Chloroflexi bacterium]|nr:methyltransferase domain-containing protein [Chloroflexota bacterium]
MMNNNDSSKTSQRKQQVAGLFDRVATTFDHVGPRFFSHFGRRLVELAHIPNGAHVLDVATGRGAALIPAAESVGTHGHVVGIDLSEIMVQETAKELTRLGFSSNVEARQMDAEHLQFPDESFDYVLCAFGIFFFPQLDRAIDRNPFVGLAVAVVVQLVAPALRSLPTNDTTWSFRLADTT